MEWLKIATPIVAAFIAALIGSFFGAFFKEQVSAWFSDKKKRTEINTSLIKCIVVYFGLTKQLMDFKNNYNVHETLIKKIRELKDAASLTDDDRRVMIEEIDNISKHNTVIANSSREVYSKVIEIESNIASLSLEAAHYFSSSKCQRLNKTIRELREFSDDGITIIKGYKELAFKDFNDYRREKYFDDLKHVLKVIDDIGYRYEERINEILKEYP